MTHNAPEATVSPHRVSPWTTTAPVVTTAHVELGAEARRRIEGRHPEDVQQ